MAVPGALQGGLLLRTLFCLALGIPALPSAAAAEQAGTLEVDVGSGPLAPALQQWARQSGIALLFDARELDGLRTAGTHGHRDAAAALKELVAGMPVNILRTPAGGFVVRRTRPAPPSPPSAAARATPAARSPHKSADAPPQEEVDTIPEASSAPPGDAATCRDAIGETASARLVQRCIAVSPATRPPCNALNTCEMIQGEIDRSCEMFPAGEKPAECAG